MANFDLIEYQKRVISDLMAENKALKDEVQAVKDMCIKIQYGGEELTVQEVCERLERAESALKKARAGNKWVSVKDKFPSTDGEYLVASASAGARFVETSFCFAKEKRWALFDGLITHWMELPGPPEIEE